MIRTQVDGAIQLIRTEYDEMPGLSLNWWQIQCLCRLSDDLCEQALTSLLRTGFLVRNRNGAYQRTPEPLTGSAPPPSPAH